MKCTVCGAEITGALVCKDCAKNISNDLNKNDWIDTAIKILGWIVLAFILIAIGKYLGN